MLKEIARRGLPLVVVAALIPACNLDGSMGPSTGPAIATLTAILRGSQVVPGVVTPGDGAGSFTVNAIVGTVNYTVTFSGLSNITSVKIYAGSPGVRSSVGIFSLAGGAAASPLVGTASAANFTPDASQNIFSVTDGINALLAGNCYVEIATSTVGGGEIRGQIGTAHVAAAKLSGAQVVPPIVAPAPVGAATFTFNENQSTITVTLTYSGLTSATAAARVFAGKAGANGTAPFFNITTTAAFPSPLTVVMDATATFFTAVPADGIATFADAINALLSGDTYVTIETATVPEVRGQIGPTRFASLLNTAQETTPPVGTSPSVGGTGVFVLNGMQTAIAYQVSYANVSVPINIVQIRLGDVGVAGAVIFPVPITSTPLTGNLSSTLNVATLPTFADFVDAAVTSGTYVEIRTTLNPLGEIRGQIVP